MIEWGKRKNMKRKSTIGEVMNDDDEWKWRRKDVIIATVKSNNIINCNPTFIYHRNMNEPEIRTKVNNEHDRRHNIPLMLSFAYRSSVKRMWCYVLPLRVQLAVREWCKRAQNSYVPAYDVPRGTPASGGWGLKKKTKTPKNYLNKKINLYTAILSSNQDKTWNK